MDQGVIQALNIKYYSLAVRKLILALENETPITTISILSAMIILTKSLDALSSKTFNNCFEIAAIS